jgi:hypothetical protein
MIAHTVTNGHQIQKDEIWFNKFTEWINGFLPAAEGHKSDQWTQNGSGADDIEEWKVVRASGNGWQGINGAVPGRYTSETEHHHLLTTLA